MVAPSATSRGTLENVYLPDIFDIVGVPIKYNGYCPANFIVRVFVETIPPNVKPLSRVWDIGLFSFPHKSLAIPPFDGDIP
jgi:hypothetical protein